MKNYNSIYLGLVINNDDPQKRGRVQIFVPHIMPALYKDWNEEGMDIELSCVGDNVVNGLPSNVVDRLVKILPWAESASPILGTSSPGNVVSAETIGGFIGGAVGAGFGGIVGQAAGAAVGRAAGRFLDSSPVAEPTEIGELADLLAEASKYAGNDARGSKVRNTLNGTRGGNNCGRGSKAIIGALTGNPRFANSGGLGGNANDFGARGTKDFTDSGIYQPKSQLPSNYMNDPSQWRVGDVVANGGGSQGYGHIQVWTGKAWVSDFNQGNKILDNANYTGFALHRLNPKGAAAVSARAGKLLGNQPTFDTTSSSGEAVANVHQSPEGPPTLTDESSLLYGSAADPRSDSSSIDLTDVPDYSLSLTEQQQSAVNSFLNNYQKNLPQYQAVSNNLKQQGINIAPSQVAALQWREGSGDLTKSIANGQRLGTNIRKDGRLGEGSATNSFTNTTNWVQNATEVLSYKVKEKYGTTSKDFNSQAQFNDFAERFNGLGYRKKGIASPYVYSGTNLYTGGKYVADGKFDPTVKDKQVGTAVLVDAANKKIDPSQFSSTASVDQTTAQTQSFAADNINPPTSIVNNPDPNGPTVTQNINNMAKGVFSFPAAGAMVWLFFREGNPLYPVYFAASYSAAEWQSAYRQGSDVNGYAPAQGSTGGVMNLNGVGGLRWEDTNNYEDRTQEQKSLMLFGYDGSNMFFNDGYHQIFSKFDRRDQVEKHRWESTLGSKEVWTQGDENRVCMGDLIIKVGNVSRPAVDAVNRINEILAEAQQPLLESQS